MGKLGRGDVVTLDFGMFGYLIIIASILGMGELDVWMLGCWDWD